jgi:thiamine biosynthesis lipoprotein ApbE
MGVRLSSNDIADLKNQGYSETEIQQAMNEIEREELSGSYDNIQRQRHYDPRQNSQISSFSAKTEDNIVRWQLELNDILERAEHI